MLKVGISIKVGSANGPATTKIALTTNSGTIEKLYRGVSREEVCDAIQDYLTSARIPFSFEGDCSTSYDNGIRIEYALTIHSLKPNDTGLIRIVNLGNLSPVFDWPDPGLLESIPGDRPEIQN